MTTLESLQKEARESVQEKYYFWVETPAQYDNVMKTIDQIVESSYLAGYADAHKKTLPL